MNITATITNSNQLNGAATNDQTLTGQVTGGLEVSGNLSSSESVAGFANAGDTLNGIADSKGSLSGNMAVAYAVEAERYNGEYDVTPQVDKQMLKTKHKYMTDDVRILAIPYFEVGNTTGGNTVYIAEKIEVE